MIDVFVRLAPMNRMRARLAEAVISRLGMYEGARLWLVICHGSEDVEACIYDAASGKPIRTRIMHLGPEQFWNRSRELADKIAASDIYCMIDDDQLPLGPNWLTLGAHLQQCHQWGMISSVSVNGENPLPPSDGGDLVDAASCGTPYFARKGTLGTYFPPCDIAEADMLSSVAIRHSGLRIGFARSLRHNHLGYGYSQAVPEWSAHPGPRA